MSESKALSPIAQEDYEAIEAAVMETQRGRWFLSEYARRNRTADTTMLLCAIERLENTVRGARETDRMDRLRFDLVEMARAITSTKREIAAIRPSEGTQSDLEVASEALDGIVRTTERATSDILEAAEHVQEAAWTLREDGARDDLCDELDRRATEIYTSCSFQDLTAQRTKRIIGTLRFLEGRIDAMIDIWGVSVDDDDAPADAQPREDLQTKLDVFAGLDQTAIDDVIVEHGPSGAARGAFADVTVIEPAIDGRIVRAAPPTADVAWAELSCAETIEDAELGVDPEIETTAWEPSPPDVAFELDVDETPATAHDPSPEPDAPTYDRDAVLARADAAVSDASSALDLDAFTDIDALTTREKLARFS